MGVGRISRARPDKERPRPHSPGNVDPVWGRGGISESCFSISPGLWDLRPGFSARALWGSPSSVLDRVGDEGRKDGNALKSSGEVSV